MSQGGKGRDHNPYGFTMWLAGGGVKGGQAVGATDEFGLQRRRRPRRRPRLPRHHPAPARPRPRAADVPAQRPRRAADRRGRAGHRPGAGITREAGHARALGTFGLALLTFLGRFVRPRPRRRAVVATPTHWAFRKPVRPATPAVRDTAWVRTPLDAFVLARLEEAGLRPAPPAGRSDLLRRVTFDLTGLPPTPEEVDGLPARHAPGRLRPGRGPPAGSPAYGERWAQHWLDVVRYAESNGYEADGERPHAWRYRDYVIRAFNDDMPYDRFVTEQLAGDRLARGQDDRANVGALVATGFNRCGPVHLVGGNIDPEVNRQEVLTEMTDAVGVGLPRPDGRLCPLPRPQIRPDPAGGLLPPASVLRGHPAPGHRSGDEPKRSPTVSSRCRKSRRKPPL